MAPVDSDNAAASALLARMVEAKQLSAADADNLLRQSRQQAGPGVKSEEDVLRWLAKE
jgi:hypothetical protein